MNKYQEAFDVVDTVLHLMCGEKREDGYEPTMEELTKAMADFQELVEKATSKKYVERVEFVDEVKWMHASCPNCKEIIDEFGYYPYCPNCGQSLDWSEEE